MFPFLMQQPEQLHKSRGYFLNCGMIMVFISLKAYGCYHTIAWI
jgi:hypothetical protein